MVLFINSEVVKQHHPDRVLRQFRLRQYVPQLCDIGMTLHKIDCHGRAAANNWVARQASWIERWDQQQHHIVMGTPQHGLVMRMIRI